jgi:hypothetical protein
MAAIGQITEEMTSAGVVLETGGLLPSVLGARLRLARSTVTVVDGPFAEAKELVGGYAIIRAASKEDAIALGSRFLKVHEEALGPSYVGEIEIRQMAEW